MPINHEPLDSLVIVVLGWSQSRNFIAIIIIILEKSTGVLSFSVQDQGSSSTGSPVAAPAQMRMINPGTDVLSDLAGGRAAATVRGMIRKRRNYAIVFLWTLLLLLLRVNGPPW